jgi:hypothetical protein
MPPTPQYASNQLEVEMAVDITKIPLQELLDDKAASLLDIKACVLAFLHVIQEYNASSVQARLVINHGIVAVIDKELARRAGMLIANPTD